MSAGGQLRTQSVLNEFPLVYLQVWTGHTVVQFLFAQAASFTANLPVKAFQLRTGVAWTERWIGQAHSLELREKQVGTQNPRVSCLLNGTQLTMNVVASHLRGFPKAQRTSPQPGPAAESLKQQLQVRNPRTKVCTPPTICVVFCSVWPQKLPAC